MIRFATAALLMLALGSAPALGQELLEIDLAVVGGGAASDIAEGVAIAPDGSYYVAGTFNGTATFGDVTITSSGDSDFFLVKYTEDGTAVWARRGGTSVFNDFGRDVAVDAQGNAYYVGNFTGIATWDGGGNPDIEITTRNDWDGFVAKYTPNGDLEWVQQLGGPGQDSANGVAVGPDGTVYVGGGFRATGIFGDFTLTSNGSEDGYLVAIDPEDGDVLWAAQAGGSDGDTIHSLDVDAAGNVYAAGQFRGVGVLFGSPHQSNGMTDIFVAKLTAEGDPVWVTAFGGAGFDYARGLGVSADGHSVVTGSHDQDVLVNQDILQSAGASDVLVATLDPDGNLMWGRNGGGSGHDFSEGAAMDDAGNSYVTGYVAESGTFGTEPYTSQGFNDIFLAVYDIEGDLIHLELMGGTNTDEGKDVALGAGRFAVTGSFRGPATFGDFELTGPGGNDVFLVAGEAIDLDLDDPVAQVDPESLEIVVMEGEMGETSLTISNTAAEGSAGLTFSLSADADEVAFDPAAGSVAAGSNVEVMVSFDAAEVEPGDHEIDVVISTNDPGATTIEVPLAVTVEPKISGEDEGTALTDTLHAAYPNPFAGSATLGLELAKAQEVTVTVYDALGRRVAVLHEGLLPMGEHRVVFEGAGLPSGTYVIQADGVHFQQTQRATLVR